MTREERKIFQGCILAMAALIVAIVAVLTESCETANLTVYAAQMVQDEEIITESSTEPEKADFRDSAMPCDDPDGFKEWLATYEQTASEERYSERTEVPQTVETECVYAEPTEEIPLETEIPLYAIDGEVLNPDLQRLLYHYLEEAGIEYWYTGALAQMFQESHCRQYAENPNGLDKGIYQYRTTYWNWSDGDIFDVDAQMRRYASEMAARFNAGLSTDEAISRHKTSDYCTTIDWTYVGHVKQWLSQMEAIK